MSLFSWAGLAQAGHEENPLFINCKFNLFRTTLRNKFRQNNTKTMVRRRSLKGIAFGLATSFASRNNDADGYWAMGKLLRYANVSGATELQIDLLAASEKPLADDTVGLVADRYKKHLNKQLATQQLSPSWAAAARVHIDFSVPDGDLKRLTIFGRGQPFACAVEIVDDHGRMYSAKAYGLVTEHDPGKEHRSVRRDEF